MPFYGAVVNFKARDDAHAKEIMGKLRELMITETTWAERDKYCKVVTNHVHIDYYKSLE